MEKKKWKRNISFSTRNWKEKKKKYLFLLLQEELPLHKLEDKRFIKLYTSYPEKPHLCHEFENKLMKRSTCPSFLTTPLGYTATQHFI
jgi:hypothetical protein